MQTAPKADGVNVFPPFPSQVHAGESAEEGWARYLKEHNESINNSDHYWGTLAKKHLHWFTDFTSVQGGSFMEGDINWFAEGTLNACFNCIDRHLASFGDKVSVFYSVIIMLHIW